MTDAKYCPMCGGQPIVEVWRGKSPDDTPEHYVQCYAPRCRVRGPIRETEADALEAWNMRCTNRGEG
jgi:Lar family restriction alleviation protein